MQYHCLIYFDPMAVFNDSPEANAMLADIAPQTEKLKASGHFIMAQPRAPTIVQRIVRDESRRVTRMTAAGDLVLLEDQDRAQWDRALITEAENLLKRAMTYRRVGPYLLQAAIAAVHAGAPSTVETDWTEIIALYDVLLRIDRSPIVALNRAVAVGMNDGFRTGLSAIDAATRDGDLNSYHLAHAARADMQRRLGLTEAAKTSDQRALELTRQPAERRFLEARLAQVSEESGSVGGSTL
jgi:RNA polymerase sigma-70 factor, ECF subfamily